MIITALRKTASRVSVLRLSVTVLHIDGLHVSVRPEQEKAIRSHTHTPLLPLPRREQINGFLRELVKIRKAREDATELGLRAAYLHFFLSETGIVKLVSAGVYR